MKGNRGCRPVGCSQAIGIAQAAGSGRFLRGGRTGEARGGEGREDDWGKAGTHQETDANATALKQG